MVDDAHSGRPSPESRRQQILDAACDRVRHSGFHGASMADIAKAAGLSVGQIYRYFENKEAIIAAIVAQDLAEMRDKFAELESQPGTLLDAIDEHLPESIDKCFEPGRAALALEVIAEAARNPKVAAIVRSADDQERQMARSLMERSRKPEWSEAEFQARCEAIGLIFDGLLMRGVNHPDLDREALSLVLRSTVRHLLS
ncbi:TetR/AcrR family transcriptional regulator [Caulobacter segnis]|uniref:Transcriptional regulator, TetR family n=2 Tax=Caulobacter segnis TaxID=88688 RepID=D5VNB9_CAUST|nr:TetR/AcrR family transcriptional regulator [Caulobacter segnis]ADG11992.1 transcriptional regulator, TetR family [Caulobacter segnis ATCC 21756]AVQ03611.1 TetR/AcrR family transcriptional regulator [Caulobacter segnis]